MPWIQPATDGPKPLSPEDSQKSFRVPEGFRVELVASEPLIEEPSGVCWDELGRMYVTELHGYNLEGQFDVEELNKTGELDRVVRRIQANERAKEAALAGTYGVIKQLSDSDGDGRMDRMTVFADNLPPCYGAVPARGGIIVACAPHIIYLRDDDDDGHADHRETLYTGFKTGVLERGVNAPQWGPDNWIYFGRGHHSDSITGPNLNGSVNVGGNDFRVRADGTAIEPVAGSTGTFGHAFTVEGDRITIGTGTPGYQVIPLPWRYLSRNPDYAVPSLERNAANYNRVYPIAPPHPWRTRREQDPGFFKYYRDRYGASDSEAGGYFTSGCSPIVYQDIAFPAQFHGNHFSCEPAQNLIHRSRAHWDGPVLHLDRPPEEQQSEFLASSDQWFHPMNLTHGPDGALSITDFYREIIEDYSAIPRYLQQQYGLTNGMNYGRIWRLTHEQAPVVPSAIMASLSNGELAGEVGSDQQWRRETARRLLVERNGADASAGLSTILENPGSAAAAAINALYTLEGIGSLKAGNIQDALSHSVWYVGRHALLIGDRHPAGDPVKRVVRDWLFDPGNLDGNPRLLLQIGLSLGEFNEPQSIEQLALLARNHGEVRWMDTAIATSTRNREHELIAMLFNEPGKSGDLSERLVATIAARGDQAQITQTLELLEGNESNQLFARILESALAGAGQEQERIEVDPPETPSAAELTQIEEKLPKFTAALSGNRDTSRGRELFVEHCATCHVAKGLGSVMGPNLDSEFQRAQETILRDILFPHETITAGFETVRLEMRSGSDAVGVRSSESPTSYSLRLPGGTEMTFLRRKIRRVHTHNVSLMPPTFADVLKPDEVADIIQFVRIR
jgi:putative membrane-bound dehydrogenase-like protein